MASEAKGHKSGEIFRVGSSSKSELGRWKKEWGIVTLHFFTAYKDKSEEKRRKRIPIPLCAIEPMVPIEELSGAPKANPFNLTHGFALTSPKSTVRVLFGSTSERECAEWVSVINVMKSMARGKRKQQNRRSKLLSFDHPIVAPPDEESNGEEQEERMNSAGKDFTADVRRAIRQSTVASQLFSMPDRVVCSKCGVKGTCFSTSGVPLCVDCSPETLMSPSQHTYSRVAKVETQAHAIRRKSKMVRANQRLARELAGASNLQGNESATMRSKELMKFAEQQECSLEGRRRGQAPKRRNVSTGGRLGKPSRPRGSDAVCTDDERDAELLVALEEEAKEQAKKRDSVLEEAEPKGDLVDESVLKKLSTTEPPRPPSITVEEVDVEASVPSSGEASSTLTVPSLRGNSLFAGYSAVATLRKSEEKKKFRLSMLAYQDEDTVCSSLTATEDVAEAEADDLEFSDDDATPRVNREGSHGVGDLEEEEEIYEHDDEDDFLSDDEDDDEDGGDGDKSRALDWNSRFQCIMESMDTRGSVYSNISTYLAMIGLAQDFLYSATSYGKIIISEVYLPDHEKTIKPALVGGVAGGSKYIVQDILFKFALDTDGLYGGNDAAASKVGGHELKGLQSYFNCNIDTLSLPLMALVDYRGFRLIAISLLPINEDTLVYGSSDGGRTIHNKDEHMNEVMKKAAEVLNIKPHLAGYYENERKVMYSAADIEGHKGLDGRYYLLDFSRTFPCERPDPTLRGSNLYHLFRPEFVKSYPISLCSDAYSSFCTKEFARDIDAATDHLHCNVIPELGRDLPRLLQDTGRDFTSFRLTEIIHSRGVNVRHLGLLLNAVHALPGSISGPFKQQCRAMILVEMFARVVKDKMRTQLRKRMKKLKKPLEEPYRKLVVDYLNLVMGNRPKSDLYWDTSLKRDVLKKFRGTRPDALLFLPPAEKAPVATASSSRRLFGRKKKEKKSSSSGSLSSSGGSSGSLSELPKVITNQDTTMRSILYAQAGGLDIDIRWVLLDRLRQMMGLTFTDQALVDLSTNCNGKLDKTKPFARSDIESIGERIKHMNIVSHAEGYLLVVKAMECRATDSQTAVSSLRQAINKFEEVLNSNSTNKVTLKHCARALLMLDEELRRMSNEAFDTSRPNILRAKMYFDKALEIDPRDAQTLCQMAQFMEACGDVETAERFYLKALEYDPADVEVMRAYGSLLETMGEYDAAEQFFTRITNREDYRW